MAKKNGRPRALDEIKRREICAITSAGFGALTAAQYVGCSMRTIEREVVRDRDFFEVYRRARLSSQLDPLNCVRNAAKTHWRAAAWLLERLRPQEFARRGALMVDPQDFHKAIEVIEREIRRVIREPRLQDRVLASINRAAGNMHPVTTDRLKPRAKPRPPRQADVTPPLPPWFGEEPPEDDDNANVPGAPPAPTARAATPEEQAAAVDAGAASAPAGEQTPQPPPTNPVDYGSVRVYDLESLASEHPAPNHPSQRAEEEDGNDKT